MEKNAGMFSSKTLISFQELLYNELHKLNSILSCHRDCLRRHDTAMNLNTNIVQK